MEYATYISKLKGEPEENGPFVKEVSALLEEKKLEQMYQTFSTATKILLDAPEKGIWGDWLYMLSVLFGDDDECYPSNEFFKIEFEAVYNLLIAILRSASPETHPDLIKASIKILEEDERDKAIQKLRVLVLQ